jgi:two-component system, cell cycle sensor histidine kinase and response regulator CckA
MLSLGDDRFGVLFETSPVGMAFASLDGTVVAVNPAACRLWGRTEDELVGSPGPQLVHPDDRDEAARGIRQLLVCGVAEVRVERRYVQPSGTVIWAEMVTQAVRAPDGAPLYLRSVLVDVTERKRAEEARSWLEEVVQSSQDAIIGTTLKGVILNWNSGAERIFGYTAEELVGCSATVLRRPGSEDDVARLMTRIGRGERIEHRVVRVRKDGTAVTLLASSTPIRDASGAIVGTATIARDVGERERADAMFRSLLEAAPDAMVCVNVHDVIALVNAQAEQLFGYARDELIGRPVETLVPNFAHPDPRRVGTAQELSARCKDGRAFPAEISWSTIQTQDGPLVSATIRDGTERRHAAIVASSTDAVIGRSLNGTPGDMVSRVAVMTEQIYTLRAPLRTRRIRMIAAWLSTCLREFRSASMRRPWSGTSGCWGRRRASSRTTSRRCGSSPNTGMSTSSSYPSTPATPSTRSSSTTSTRASRRSPSGGSSR